MVTMPYNFYIQVVFIKEDRLSIGHAVPEILDFKERDGAGPGRAANTQIFPLNTKELAPLAASLARNKKGPGSNCK